MRFEPVRDASRSSIRSIESIGDSLEGEEKYAVVSLAFDYVRSTPYTGDEKAQVGPWGLCQDSHGVLGGWAVVSLHP